jgi:ABC-2 type transport system permease protein
MRADTRPTATDRPAQQLPERPQLQGRRTARPVAVLRGVLRDQRRGLLGWGIALAAVSFIYVSFYPAIGAEQMADMAAMIPDDLAAALGYDRLADAPGYITATVYGLLGPALLLVFAIGAGARLFAGLEEDGTLELELTHPVARRTVYVERLLGLWTSALLLTLVTGLVTTLLVVVLDIDVTLGGLAAGTLGLFLLTVTFGTVAYAVGAATGRRTLGLAGGAGLAVASYLADAVGPMAGADWLSTVSPWGWYLGDDPLSNGVDVGGYGLLAALTLVAAVSGLQRLRHRDLGV